MLLDAAAGSAWATRDPDVDCKILRTPEGLGGAT